MAVQTSRLGILHVFLSNKHNQSCSELPDLEKLLKTRKSYHRFSTTTVNMCDMHEHQTDVSEYPWTWGEINFRSKFTSEHQIFSFENCYLGEKRRLKVEETFRKFGGGGGRDLQ